MPKRKRPTGKKVGTLIGDDPWTRRQLAIEYAINLIAAAIAQENLGEAWRSSRSTENVLKIELQHIPTAAEFKDQRAAALRKLSGVVNLPSLHQSGPLDEVFMAAKKELEEQVDRLALAPPQWWCDERNRSEFIGAYRSAEGAVYADIPGLPANASIEKLVAAEEALRSSQKVAMKELRAAQTACGEREDELVKRSPDLLIRLILEPETIDDPELVAARGNVAEKLAAVEALDYGKSMVDPEDVPKVLTTANKRADARKVKALIAELTDLSRRVENGRGTKRIAGQIAAKRRKLNMLRLRESYGRFGARGTVTKMLAATKIAERRTGKK